MIYIATGVLGFVSFLLFDVFTVRRNVVLKYMFLVIGIGLIGYSSWKMIGLSPNLTVSSVTQVAGGILSVVFGFLTVYSVFIEVRFAYQKDRGMHLVTTGTYSLVRHPGVIWLFLTVFFLSILLANGFLLMSAFIWTTVNALYIMFQERYILRKLFVEYDAYIKATPMLIPNYSSIKRFMTLDNWRKE